MNLNIEKATLENEYYRRVIYTDEYQQVVLMSIPVNEDIPLEKHDTTSQFFRIESGKGEIRFGEDERESINIKDGSSVVVPPNRYHHVINTGNTPLKLYTIYSPPHHPPNRLDVNKPIEQAHFTGNRDTDIQIMMYLTDADLLSFCKTNKTIRKICRDDMFWMRKVYHDGAKVDKPVDQSWKQYYFLKYDLDELLNGTSTLFYINDTIYHFLTNSTYFTKKEREFITSILDDGIMGGTILYDYIILYLLNQNILFEHNDQLYFRPDHVINDFIHFPSFALFVNYLDYSPGGDIKNNIHNGEYIVKQYVIRKLSQYKNQKLAVD